MNPVQYARKLRKHQTPAEKIMWQLLRNRNFLSFKFLRQHPIRFTEPDYKQHFFIADFYCAEKKLVVEIDGRIHNKQKAHDRIRDQIMQELGLTVIRFPNEEVENNLAGVLARLEDLLYHL